MSPTIPKMYAGWVYVCGPISAPGVDTVRLNLEHGIQEANMLREHGIPVFSPHAHTLGLRENGNKFTGQEGYHMAMMNDFALLQYATAMYLLPGWEKSTGCRAEVLYCDEVGIPIFKNIGPLLEYMSEEHPLMDVYEMSQGAFDDRNGRG